MPLIPPLILKPRRKRKKAGKLPPAAPVATDILVVSVVALPDGSAVMTFDAAVTYNGAPPGSAIHFVVEDREGDVSEIEQAGADAVIVRVDGLPIASNAAWSIVSTPACLVPAAGAIVVPQAGSVE